MHGDCMAWRHAHGDHARVRPHLHVQVRVLHAELAQVARREELSDQVDAVVVHFLPALVRLDDVWVLEVHVGADLGHRRL
jgi:hypothetical protein